VLVDKGDWPGVFVGVDDLVGVEVIVEVNVLVTV
jgi:hypothetical protein